MKIVVAITGATGAIFGIRLLEMLKEYKSIETHLLLSKWAMKTIEIETNYSVADVIKLSDYHHDTDNLGASIASGSFEVDTMVIAPCSMKTLAAIRAGLASDLITRAADVMLKEKRKLILLPRETPLNTIHIENMLALSKMAVTMVPPMPAFYNHPQNLDDMINHIVYRIMNQIGISSDKQVRWHGLS